MKYTALQGTKDLLPEDAPKWRYIEEKIRGVLSLYNYKEIRTPVFEQTELFKRSIGDDTDIVQKEMYTFQDQGKRSLTLRPEGTASIVRAFIEHNLGERSPLVKLFYFGQMFRQERPQKGRLREFNQYGVEVIGSLDPLVDAEVIELGVRINKAFGLEGLKLYLNSIGCKDCRPAHRDAFNKFVKDKIEKFCQDCQLRLLRNPLRIFDCKNEKCVEALKDAPMILDYLDEKCKNHFKKVREYLDQMGIEYILDGRLVRGLDYYTRTTFEIKSESLGAQDTLIGGGRYDLLVSELGGKDTPAIGFAAGIERLFLVLEEAGKLPVTTYEVDVYIAPIGEETKSYCIKLLSDLRNEGYICEMDYLSRSIKSQMREAEELGAKIVMIVGENEMRSGTVVVKTSYDQKSVPFADVGQELKKYSVLGEKMLVEPSWVHKYKVYEEKEREYKDLIDKLESLKEFRNYFVHYPKILYSSTEAQLGREVIRLFEDLGFKVVHQQGRKGVPRFDVAVYHPDYGHFYIEIRLSFKGFDSSVINQLSHLKLHFDPTLPHGKILLIINPYYKEDLERRPPSFDPDDERLLKDLDITAITTQDLLNIFFAITVDKRDAKMIFEGIRNFSGVFHFGRNITT